jgi:hypothetical protein
MKPDIESEFGLLATRLNTIRMYESDRALAMGALRSAFVLVERFTWAMHKVRETGEFLFAKRALVN